MKRMCQTFVAIAAFGVAGVASAHGHGRFAIGFGFPVAPPVYFAPPPVYYAQPPVVYLAPPPPVYYQPSPVYYAPPVTVYRPVPPVREQRSDRREIVPAPQPEAPAPELAPREPRG